jgi:gliding motility-associated-like protein
MNKVIITLLSSLFLGELCSQTYTPITISGFNIDAVAETYPNSLATTTQALDQVVAGGNSVMYSAAFASAASFGGGLPNSGSIVNGLKTFQMMPFTGNNALFAPSSSINTLTLTTPASYSSLSFLVFSTEGSSTFNITINYTDLTSTNAGNFTVQDWFNGTGAVISGIGRCKRVTSGVTNDGLPTNPRLYGIDVPVTCANQQKQVASVKVTGISSNPAGGGGYVLALSGVAANVVSPTVSYGANVLCQGGASATPTLTGATGGTYASSPAGLSMTASNGAINLMTSTPNTYTVTYTTSGACSTSTTSTVTVTPSPTITVTNPTVCAGQTATLTASGATTYGWVGNNLSAITGSTVYANTASTSIYTITGTSSGCSSTVTSTLTINPLPVIVTNFAEICPGEAAVLTSTVSISGGTYTWLPDNQTTDGITESPSAATNYTVIYTVDGCSASAIAAVSMKPVPALAVNSGSICSGQTIRLTASPSIGGGTYVWQPGGEITSSISETPQTAGTYTVQYTLNGCQAFAVSSVGINPNPNAEVTSSAPSIAPLDEVSIVASGGNSYAWNTGATGAVINVKPLETTTYCATVTSVEGCKSEACVEIVVKEESTLYVPNVFTPNGDGINDEFYVPSYNLVSFDLKIFNRWGQLLFQTGDSLTGWDGSFKGQTTSGVYVFILKAKGNDGTDYKKTGHITLIQ